MKISDWLGRVWRKIESLVIGDVALPEERRHRVIDNAFYGVVVDTPVRAALASEEEKRLLGRALEEMIEEQDASARQEMAAPYQVNHLYCLQDRFVKFLEGHRLWNETSQWGEDSLIDAILGKIGTGAQYVVECGAGDGLFMSNSYRLIRMGFGALLVERDFDAYVKLQTMYRDTERVDAVHASVGTGSDPGEPSFDGLLDAVGAPDEIDLLVCDVDGPDYWLVNALHNHRPRILMVEFDPNAPHPEFIPKPGSAGQAGMHAILRLGIAKLYTPVCGTFNNIIFVRYDLAHLIDGSKPALIHHADGVKKRPQIFAGGRWQDIGDEPIETFPEELDAAQAGLLPTRVLESSQRQVRVAVAMSTNRLGFLDSADCVWSIANKINAPVFRGMGIDWGHGLSRAITDALAWTDDAGNKADYILTVDHDSYARPSELEALVRAFSLNPEVDVIVPMQSKRGTEDELLYSAMKPHNLLHDVTPITTGHFGFTLFRREVFEKIPKPWFMNRPDPAGDWGPESIYGDIHFWLLANEANLGIYLATKVHIGHGEEVISWPRVESDGTVRKFYQPVNKWLQDGGNPPIGIGVIPPVTGFSDILDLMIKDGSLMTVLGPILNHYVPPEVKEEIALVFDAKLLSQSAPIVFDPSLITNEAAALLGEGKKPFPVIAGS